MAMAKKIKKILIDRDMKVKELAELLGYSSNNFSNKLNKDNFSEKELMKIAEILNCTFKGTFIMNDTNEEI